MHSRRVVECHCGGDLWSLILKSTSIIFIRKINEQVMLNIPFYHRKCCQDTRMPLGFFMQPSHNCNQKYTRCSCLWSCAKVDLQCFYWECLNHLPLALNTMLKTCYYLFSSCQLCFAPLVRFNVKTGCKSNLGAHTRMLLKWGLF